MTKGKPCPPKGKKMGKSAPTSADALRLLSGGK